MAIPKPRLKVLIIYHSIDYAPKSNYVQELKKIFNKEFDVSEHDLNKSPEPISENINFVIVIYTKSLADNKSKFHWYDFDPTEIFCTFITNSKIPQNVIAARVVFDVNDLEKTHIEINEEFSFWIKTNSVINSAKKSHFEESITELDKIENMDNKLLNYHNNMFIATKKRISKIFSQFANDKNLNFSFQKYLESRPIKDKWDSFLNPSDYIQRFGIYRLDPYLKIPFFPVNSITNFHLPRIKIEHDIFKRGLTTYTLIQTSEEFNIYEVEKSTIDLSSYNDSDNPLMMLINDIIGKPSHEKGEQNIRRIFFNGNLKKVDDYYYINIDEISPIEEPAKSTTSNEDQRYKERIGKIRIPIKKEDSEMPEYFKKEVLNETNIFDFLQNEWNFQLKKLSKEYFIFFKNMFSKFFEIWKFGDILYDFTPIYSIIYLELQNQSIR